MGLSLSKLFTTSKKPPTTVALDTLRELGSTATYAQQLLTHKRHTVKPQLVHELERIFKDVDYFIYRGSDRFFLYDRWAKGYRVGDLVLLMEQAAMLAELIEETMGEVALTAGPSYTLTGGDIL